MCRLFLLTVFLFKMLVLNAQGAQSIELPAPHQPMFKEGKIWHYRQTRGGYDHEAGSLRVDTTYVRLTIKGDTIINGEQCWKMYRETTTQSELNSIWLERDLQVFRIDTDSDNKKELIFDFTPSKGCGFPAFGSGNYVLDAIDAIEVESRMYNRYYYHPNGYSNQSEALLVEGIGTFNGIENLEGLYAGWNTFCFLRCYENGEVIFSAEDFNLPSVGGIQTIDNSQLKIDKWYDLQGRKVQSNRVTRSQSNTLLKGVYIVNGKKVVIK